MPRLLVSLPKPKTLQSAHELRQPVCLWTTHRRQDGSTKCKLDVKIWFFADGTKNNGDGNAHYDGLPVSSKNHESVSCLS